MSREDYLRSNGSDRFLVIPVLLMIVAAAFLVAQLT